MEVIKVSKRGRIIKDPPGQSRLRKSAVRGAAKRAIWGEEADSYGKEVNTTFGKKPRDTVTYELRNGREVVYRGITTDPEIREVEHLREGKDFTKLVVTSRRMTREGAEKKEAESLATYRRNHGGKNPKYNQNGIG